MWNLLFFLIGKCKVSCENIQYRPVQSYHCLIWQQSCSIISLREGRGKGRGLCGTLHEIPGPLLLKIHYRQINILRELLPQLGTKSQDLGHFLLLSGSSDTCLILFHITDIIFMILANEASLTLECYFCLSHIEFDTKDIWNNIKWSVTLEFFLWPSIWYYFSSKV